MAIYLGKYLVLVPIQQTIKTTRKKMWIVKNKYCPKISIFDEQKFTTGWGGGAGQPLARNFALILPILPCYWNLLRLIQGFGSRSFEIMEKVFFTLATLVNQYYSRIFRVALQTKISRHWLLLLQTHQLIFVVKGKITQRKLMQAY